MNEFQGDLPRGSGESPSVPSPERIRIAVQRRGRLAKCSLDLLQSIGLDFDYHEGRLFAPCSNFPLELLFVRDDDIPQLVQDGVADLGIAGRNVVEEKGGDVECLESLGFGICSLKIAVRAGGPLATLTDLEGKRIATSHPSILFRYLKEKGLDSTVVEISGSVEITPILNVADAVCDLVSTGSTLKMNGLRPLATVLESEAVLISHPNQREGKQKEPFIERLRARLRSCLRARKMRYLMMNVRRSDWDSLKKVLPNLSSPTVVPLARPGWIAIHSAVPEKAVWNTIEELTRRGARDILSVPVDIMVP